MSISPHTRISRGLSVFTTAGDETFVLHLAVDGEPDIQLLARAVLEAAGYRVVGEAACGAEALIESSVENPRPEARVIFLDNRT